MTDIKFIAPAIGDRFVILPELEYGNDVYPGEKDAGTIIVTDVNIIPNGFIVEGLPIVRDEDDFSTMTRKFVDEPIKVCPYDGTNLSDPANWNDNGECVECHARYWSKH